MGGAKKGGKVSVNKMEAQVSASTAKSTDTKEKPRHTCLHSQLHKTKFCLYHLKGACQFGSNCSFAHSCAELQATPDLRKTRLCANFFEGGGCNDADCTFAHSEEDLRSTDMFYKKTLCIWNEKGKCRNGDQCRFAHGLSELRLNKAAEQMQLAKAESQKKDDVKEEEAKQKDVKTIEKDKDLNTGDMGRQTSDESQVTTASGGSNGSTTGSLSGNDGNGSATGTMSTSTRRARARGKRGGGVPANQKTQVNGSPDAAGNAGVPQPMKVVLNRNLMSTGRPEPAPKPAPAPVPTNPANGGSSGPLTASSLSQLNNGTYDPLLEAELRKLRASVNALAMQCSQINEQINVEALMNQAALRQQLLNLVQARQEETALPLLMASRLGPTNLANLSVLLGGQPF
ncbi:unnamed protein product [Effrenium voratum]|nr:unnamed protein product [Effrenium voratum]|eukprot:CAMPEP_0181435750 /NCGR_PEP_ID=MMETSP1110-20121109/20494_1 /TAXON_ID=174948 /ORGANISM="Symbiodinium sp., Strain CCMP421" /LENGTH=399 /DNA_ID=CAMNT_0023559295 /DNA_START=128 /DNA_END=1327 /DNA_ORIENTATION=+